LVLLLGWDSTAKDAEDLKLQWAPLLTQVEDLYSHIFFFSYNRGTPESYSDEDTRQSIWSNHVPLLFDFLQACKQKYVIKSFDLIGHSMGGVVAMQYIKTYAFGESTREWVKHVITLHSPINGTMRVNLKRLGLAALTDPAALDMITIYNSRAHHVKLNQQVAEILSSTSTPANQRVHIFSIANSKDGAVAVSDAEIAAQGHSYDFDLGWGDAHLGLSGIFGHNQIYRLETDYACVVRNFIYALLKKDPSEEIGSYPNISPPPSVANNSSQFTNIQSPPNNAIVAPNQAIHKTWRVKNTGNRIWGSDYKLVFIGGNQMGAPNEVNIPLTEPGGVADISIDITAPSTSGTHRGEWRLRNSQGTFFGDKLWVRLTTQRASNYLTLTTDPPSPSAAGRITVQAKAHNFPNLRAMRLRIDGVVVHELGAAEFYYDWNTAVYAPGIHSITLEVADQTDTEWQHPEVHSLVYTLTGTMNNLNRAPYKPALTSPHDWTVYYTGNTAQLCAQTNGDPDGDSVTAYFFESIGNWNSGWVNGNCVTTAALAPRTYQWHVKVRDSKGAESAWSDDWHFTLVNPVLSITQLAFEPQDGNSEAVKIRACTAGQGGVGITLRVSINAANDGSVNGIWRTIHELGVPCYNDIDAPIWYTLDYADGPHRVRVEAHGSSTGWDGATVREEVYTLPHRRPAWTQLVSPVPLSQNQHEAIYLNTRSITFRWQPTLRAENYTLHISTQPNPQQDGAPVFRQTLPAGTTAHTLEFDQAYPILYWQVTTTNSQGSNTAGAQRFGVDQTLPSCNLQALPTVTYENIFQVAWSTADDLAGVKSADVQYLDERDPIWRDWQIATPSAQSFDLFIGQPGHTYRFRCRARDYAGNQGVYTNPSAAIQIDPSVRPVEPWWNTSYTQRRSMTVLNNMTAAALPVGYPLLVRLDNTTTPSAATLFNASATAGKCNDVRVVYNNASELPRYIPVCTTDRIEIWLSNQAPLAPAAANNTAYRLYYGNAGAGEPPADQTQIWPPVRDGNTAGLWFFSEGTGSTLADHSGYGNPGHLRGLTWVDGIFGKALASTTHASGNGALIPGSAALGAAAFTLEFFAKRDDLEGGYIAGQGRSGDDSERMRLRVEGPGSLSFQIDPPAPGGASDIRAQSGCLPDLQWHHIAVTFDGVREGHIYCDGVLAGSGLFNATGISNRNFDLYLGSDFSDAGRFKGAIDQVRFSTIVRTTFPQAQFAAITAPPSLAVGDVVPSAAIGAPDLVVLGLNTYPHAEGGVIVEALVQNQGNRETQNGFYTDLYIDHLPTGAGDYTGSAQFWVNSPIAAGATVTLTTVVTDFIGSGVSAAQSQAPAAEITHLLYMQTDSAGVVPDANKANNILATGVEVCFATPDAFEGDDVVTQAATLPFNQAQSHNFSDTGDQDWVKFNAEAGKEYTFSTRNLGPAADTYLYLYDTDGATLLTANDDGNDTLASQIQWVAPTSATYYLLVRHWNPNVSGCGSGYELLMESGPTAPTPTFTPTPTVVVQPPVTATPTPTVVNPPLVITYAVYLPNVQQNNQNNLPNVDATPTAAPTTGFMVSGIVYHSTTPLPNIKIDLIPGDGSRPPLATSNTNNEGNFMFTQVPPGNYTLKRYGPTSDYIAWSANSLQVQTSHVAVTLDLPKKMTLLSPPNRSTVNTPSPTFCWQALPTATKYTFQLNQSASWALVEQVNNLTNTCYTTTRTLQNNTQHTWQIDAYDGAGHWVGSTDNAFTLVTN